MRTGRPGAARLGTQPFPGGRRATPRPRAPGRTRSPQRGGQAKSESDTSHRTDLNLVRGLTRIPVLPLTTRFEGNNSGTLGECR